MRITVELLKEYEACVEQVELFEQFLNGRQYILTTDRNIQLASKYGLDIIWASDADLIKLDGCYESADGTKRWFQNGEYHRLNGPAIEYANGDKLWYQNGNLHRLDGPACEYVNGDKYWYQNGRYHRLDGPAIECADGYKTWYIENVWLTESEFNERTKIRDESSVF